jgi:biopolymer transport protein ExbD
MGVSLPGGGGKRGLDFEINLVPFIVLLCCIISFLLVTAVWTQLGKLDLKISEIKDKRVAVDAVKTAKALGHNDSSLTDKITSLSKEIDDMFVGVETTMRVEEEKLKDLQSQTISADELLTETGSDLDATMGEIDAILGKGGGK